MRKMPLLIDCDPGYDDALSLLYAAVHFHVVGITTVYGNQSLDKVTHNALQIAELAGLDVPVSSGMDRPWVAAPQHNSGKPLHGESGLDGVALPSPVGRPTGQHAVQFIIEQAHRHEGLVVAALGPLTNVATALRMDPSLAGRLKAITLMGGSTDIGNATPVSEFNIWTDPEAAHAVFASGARIYMTGLNVTREVGVERADLQIFRGIQGRVAQASIQILDNYCRQVQEVLGRQHAYLHDPCALVRFVAPELMRFQAMDVEVELARGSVRGMTVCDRRQLDRDDALPQSDAANEVAQAGQVQVAVEAASDQVLDHILNTLMSRD